MGPSWEGGLVLEKVQSSWRGQLWDLPGGPGRQCIPLGMAEAQGTLADITSLQAKELGWALAASCRAGMGYEQGAGMPWSDGSPGRAQLLPQCPGPDFQTSSKDGSQAQQALCSIIAGIPLLQPMDLLVEAAKPGRDEREEWLCWRNPSVCPLCSPHRSASSTSAARAGTGSTQWRSCATTAR